MREGEGFSVLGRHVLLRIDFSVPAPGVFQLVVVWSGKGPSCPQAERRDPVPPPRALWGSGLVSYSLLEGGSN